MCVLLCGYRRWCLLFVVLSQRFLFLVQSSDKSSEPAPLHHPPTSRMPQCRCVVVHHHRIALITPPPSSPPLATPWQAQALSTTDGQTTSPHLVGLLVLSLPPTLLPPVGRRASPAAACSRPRAAPHRAHHSSERSPPRSPRLWRAHPQRAPRHRAPSGGGASRDGTPTISSRSLPPRQRHWWRWWPCSTSPSSPGPSLPLQTVQLELDWHRAAPKNFQCIPTHHARRGPFLIHYVYIILSMQPSEYK